MNYLKLLSDATEPRYFLSLLSCGAEFSNHEYRGSSVTGKAYNNTIEEFIKNCQELKKPLSFDELAQAIDEGLAKSTQMEYLNPEVLGYTGLTLRLIDKEKAQNFSHYLLKKYKNIDFLEDSNAIGIDKAITSCVIDDYVMSFQKKINSVQRLDEYLKRIVTVVSENRDIIGMHDIGCFEKQHNDRLLHEYIITSVDNHPINPTMFGKILEKGIEFIMENINLDEGIKEIMEFCKLEYSIEKSKKPTTHLKI